MLAIAGVVVLIDQVTKVLAVANLENARPIELVGDTVRLVLLRNPGAAFSMGTESTVVLSVVATVVVLGLLWFSRRVHSTWWAWGLGLILGGAAGNLPLLADAAGRAGFVDLQPDDDGVVRFLLTAGAVFLFRRQDLTKE